MKKVLRIGFAILAFQIAGRADCFCHRITAWYEALWGTVGNVSVCVAEGATEANVTVSGRAGGNDYSGSFNVSEANFPAYYQDLCDNSVSISSGPCVS